MNMLRLTGCRPSEIAGLKVEDLQLNTDIPYAMVRWTDDRRLKTPQSQRRVPLVGVALEGARELARIRKTGWLFPSLAPKDGQGNTNPAMSQRVNKLIRAAGIPKTEQLVAYSFRHTMIEALDHPAGRLGEAHRPLCGAG
ncbi:tyrosine-type recombinase/integrase [Marinicauda algicola]|uniref:tyrosine-type recombinase/integrase n=1 Tax=Marinicauda algicola TaxID=2029849 RepID=UPI0030D32184